MTRSLQTSVFPWTQHLPQAGLLLFFVLCPLTFVLPCFLGALQAVAICTGSALFASLDPRVFGAHFDPSHAAGPSTIIISHQCVYSSLLPCKQLLLYSVLTALPPYYVSLVLPGLPLVPFEIAVFCIILSLRTPWTISPCCAYYCPIDYFSFLCHTSTL